MQLNKPVSSCREESMGNVGREIDAEPDGDDNGVARDDIDGEAPEVHETSHINNGGSDTKDDNGGPEKTEEHELNKVAKYYSQTF